MRVIFSAHEQTNIFLNLLHLFLVATKTHKYYLHLSLRSTPSLRVRAACPIAPSRLKAADCSWRQGRLVCASVYGKLVLMSLPLAYTHMSLATRKQRCAQGLFTSDFQEKRRQKRGGGGGTRDKKKKKKKTEKRGYFGSVHRVDLNFPSPLCYACIR